MTFTPEEAQQAQNWALITLNTFPSAKLKESRKNPERGVIYIKTPEPKKPKGKNK